MLRVYCLMIYFHPLGAETQIRLQAASAHCYPSYQAQVHLHSDDCRPKPVTLDRQGIDKNVKHARLHYNLLNGQEHERDGGLSVVN